MVRMVLFPHDAAAAGGGGRGSAAALSKAKAHKANQACHSCRKQKRKCDKALPACGLCSRMARHCDYSEALPAPTADDIAALQLKLVELENRLNITGPSEVNLGHLSAHDPHPNHTPQLLPREPLWQNGPSPFPSAFFLDSRMFQSSGLTLPKPTSEIPPDVLQCIGSPGDLEQTMTDYFGDVHIWFPMVSRKRVTISFQLWEAGGDVALLLLAMKLVTSQPQAGFTAAENYLYTASKRYAALLESVGTTSLHYLQSLLMISLYEYGQGIYPSAWMTIGQCIRYAEFIGLSSYNENNVLGPCMTWTEDEERRRVWWAVYIMDKLASLGSNKRPMFPEPLPNDYLPVDDMLWERGNTIESMRQPVTSPWSNPASKYGRLCQAALISGTILRCQHQSAHYANPKEIIQTFEMAQTLCKVINKDCVDSPSSYFQLMAARCLNSFATIKLLGNYSSDESPSCTSQPRDDDEDDDDDEVNLHMAMADGRREIVPLARDFAANLLAFITVDEDVVKMPPMVLDATYMVAITLYDVWRETGEPQAETSLQMARKCLARLSGRWRLGREYLDMLDTHEMNSMVGGSSIPRSRSSGMSLVM